MVRKPDKEGGKIDLKPVEGSLTDLISYDRLKRCISLEINRPGPALFPEF
jgi:hypothetical protein